ncbi:MAG: SAM-dependent methyltransferase [Limisphaerales bacterium]
MELLIPIPSPGGEDPLRQEIARTLPGVVLSDPGSGLLAAQGFPASNSDCPLVLVFSRQCLPDATPTSASSIRGWANQLVDAAVNAVPPESRWRLHVWPRYEGTGGDHESKAGRHRCELVTESVRELMGKRHRELRRRLDPGTTPFGPEDALIQLLLTAPDQGFLSVAPPPTPHRRRLLLSPFPAGEIPVAVDKAAPSRAFSKLVEAEQRLGVRIERGETCVDLGASPGSWSYVALNRGASVQAVDRSPLRSDLLANPRMTFQTGDAFQFRPSRRVDWLLCDVIAAPDRSIGLIRRWLSEGWCRRFVVTIKFRGDSDYPLLDPLKEHLPSVCSDFLMTRLSANHNEVCVAGVAAFP